MSGRYNNTRRVTWREPTLIYLVNNKANPEDSNRTGYTSGSQSTRHTGTDYNGLVMIIVMSGRVPSNLLIDCTQASLHQERGGLYLYDTRRGI